MTEPEFKHYGGPYRRVYDSLDRIADALEEGDCREILRAHGIELNRIIHKDRDGKRVPFYEPLYFFTEPGESKEPGSDTHFHHLAAVKEVCRKLKAGEIDLSAPAEE